MSIYQPRRKKWPLAAGAAFSALAGLAAGWLLWGRPVPDPLAALAATRTTLHRAADAIDVVVAHAHFAAEEGEASPAYPGSATAIDRARVLFAEAEPVVRATNPEAAADLELQFAALEEAVAAHAPPGDVVERAETLARTLRATIGGEQVPA